MGPHVGVVRQGMVQIHVPGEEHLDGRPVLRGNYELRMRHGLVVNRRGQRFGNEYFFQALGAQLHAFETWGEHRFVNIPCYLRSPRKQSGLPIRIRMLTWCS